MSINLSVPEEVSSKELKPRLTVVGVGGAGGNAVNNMIRRELEGVEFVVANTDAQALEQSHAERKIQLGATLTQGLGAGSRPEIGRGAAEEAIEEVLHNLNGSHMAFIAAGMGGGTGTGAAPAIAKAAKEAGILTVAVVTKPFQFEGSHRMRLAEAGIEDLEQYVDTLIIIPNQNLFRVATENTTFADAFAMADEVLYSGVRGVTDLMVMPGLINLDFADIRSVMSEMGKAMMGTGEAEGERRALDAAEAAIANPLLDDTSMKGAKGVLINITGGKDITLFEVDEAASRIRAEVDQDAYIIIGSAFDDALQGKMRVSVVATGIDANAAVLPQPTMLRVTEAVSRPETPAAEPAPAEEMPSEAEEVTAEEPAAEAQSAAEAAAETPLARLVREAQAQPARAEEVEEADEAEAATAAADDADAPEADSDADSEEPTAEETPPAAMPGAGIQEAFIPPAPKSAEATPAEAEPDAFAAAAMTNGAREGEANAPEGADDDARPSLFERVTRTGRAAISRAVSELPVKETVGAAQVIETADFKAPAADSAPVREETPSTAPAAQPAAAAEAAVAQTQMKDLAPAPVADAAEEEEDLLDIPAFLRRQAN